MKTPRFLGILAASLVLAGSPLVHGANWPSWRGPTNDGVTEETGLPTTWSATSGNVKWKVELPDRGNSTPVVWGDKVFVTQAIEKEGRRMLLCFDKATGKKIPNSYLIGWEYSTNDDFQDVVCRIDNVILLDAGKPGEARP